MKQVDLTPYIRRALWGNEAEGRDADWTAVMKNAEDQAVLGLVFYGAEKLMAGHVSKRQVFEWVGVTEQIKQKNLLMNDELAGFDRFVKVQKIDYRVVKGQVVASCYPEPLLRQSGDIDLYCTPNH